MFGTIAVVDLRLLRALGSFRVHAPLFKAVE
jgi:hypothetical protein